MIKACQVTNFIIFFLKTIALMSTKIVYFDSFSSVISVIYTMYLETLILITYRQVTLSDLFYLQGSKQTTKITNCHGIYSLVNYYSLSWDHDDLSCYDIHLDSPPLLKYYFCFVNYRVLSFWNYITWNFMFLLV